MTVTYGRAFSPERHLSRARRWFIASKRAKKRRAECLSLAWGYLRLAAAAAERMQEPG